MIAGASSEVLIRTQVGNGEAILLDLIVNGRCCAGAPGSMHVR